MKLKEYVRRRDGLRCRLCGMTQAQHLETHDSDLHVHRLIPSVAYTVNGTVTLCHDCHNKMPRRTLDSLTDGPQETYVLAIYFNLFNPSGYEAIETILSILKQRKPSKRRDHLADICTVFDEALAIGLKQLAAKPPAD